MTVNRQWTLGARPIGERTESGFTLVEVPAPEPAEGEVFVRTRWGSLDVHASAG
jgi:NADPH-dependent curcumin reductase CurA